VKKDPSRLGDGADELAASITAFRGQGPSDERLAALAERLARAGAPLDEPAPAVHPAPPRPLERQTLALVRPRRWIDSSVLAVLAALVTGAALIAAAVVSRQRESPVSPSAPALSASVKALGAATMPGDISSSPATTARSTPASTAPSSLRPLPAASAGEPPDAPPAPAPGGSSRSRATSTEASPSPAPVTPSSSTRTPAAPRAAVASLRTASPATNGSDGTKATGEELALSEVELLKNARSALAADPLQAFALTEQCKGRSPNGAFAQEREYIAIVALLRLGRANDARSRASSFRVHYKNSAYLPRLSAMLGEE
jgi:hypothetical protein